MHIILNRVKKNSLTCPVFRKFQFVYDKRSETSGKKNYLISYKGQFVDKKKEKPYKYILDVCWLCRWFFDISGYRRHCIIINILFVGSILFYRAPGYSYLWLSKYLPGEEASGAPTNVCYIRVSALTV